jgi:hypothetical protein
MKSSISCLHVVVKSALLLAAQALPKERGHEGLWRVLEAWRHRSATGPAI